MKKILILLFGVLTNFNALAAERWDAHFKNDFLQSNELNEDDDLRYPRATNDTDFSTAISRIQKIARVSNAISLQQAIAKGSLQAKETVISELLNFGPVTPTVLRGINASELAEFVKVIEGFGKTLEVNQGITKVEERLIMLGEIYKKTNGELKVEAPKGYLEEAKTFRSKTDNINWKSLALLVDRFARTSAALADLNAEETSDAGIKFSTLKSYLKALVEDDYSHLESQLESKLLRQSELFTSLLAPVEIFNEVTKNSLYYTNEDPPFIAKLQEQVTLLGNAIDKSSNHLEPLEKLKQVIVSRHHFSGNRQLAHTAGFPAGFSDLESVFGDLQDPWVQKMVKGQSEKLKETLKQMRSVVNEAHAISNVLGLPSSESAAAIQSIYSQVLKLSRTNRTFYSDAPKLVSISTEAQKVPPTPGNIENFTQLYGNITEVANKLKAIDALLATVKFFKTEKSTDLQFIIGLTATHSPENEKKLKDSQEFQDLCKNVSKLNDSIATLQKSIKIADLLDTVINNYGEVQKYIGELKPIEKTVELLKKTPELAMAEELMKVLREARKIQIKSFDPVGKLIKDVEPKMEALEKVFKTKSPESASLTSLSDVLYSSQTIGNSARVVIGIQKALKEKKVDFRNHDLKGTGVPSNLSTQLDTFYDEAGDFKNSLKIPQDLASMSDIFELTRNVSGIPIDFLSLSASIEELAESSSNKNKLLKIKEDLDTLDTFGLNFTQHKVAIQDSKDSLNSMDLFFASFASKHSPVPLAALKQLGGTTRIPGSQNSTESGEADAGSPIVTWLAGNWYYVLGGVLLGAGAGGAVLWWKKEEEYNAPKKFVIDNGLFAIVVINWELQLTTFQLLWREIPGWADAISLYFSSFYAANSAELTALVEDEVKRDAKFYRRLVPFAEKNRFEIKDPKNQKKIAGEARLHGNWIEMPSTKQVYWLTQTPQAQSKDKVANISLFWMGVVEQRGEFVVCFERTADGQPLPYLPLKIGKTKYDDKLFIECTEITYRLDGKVVVRDLIIKFPKKKAHKVKHLQYMVWPARGLPRMTESLMNIYETIKSSPHPIFLHCNDGISKCGVFAQAVLHTQIIKSKNGPAPFLQSLNELRQHRQMAVSNEKDYMFVTLLTFEMLQKAVDKDKMGKRIEQKVAAFNAAIKDILEGRAKWTKAKLVSVDAPLPPPPPPPPAPPAAPPTAADASKAKTPQPSVQVAPIKREDVERQHEQCEKEMKEAEEKAEKERERIRAELRQERENDRKWMIRTWPKRHADYENQCYDQDEKIKNGVRKHQLEMKREKERQDALNDRCVTAEEAEEHVAKILEDQTQEQELTKEENATAPLVVMPSETKVEMPEAANPNPVPPVPPTN